MDLNCEATDGEKLRTSQVESGLLSWQSFAKGVWRVWRKLLGSDFSPFVFPNFRDPSQPAKDIRKTCGEFLMQYLPKFGIATRYPHVEEGRGDRLYLLLRDEDPTRDLSGHQTAQ
jgi:hypothetical protein